MRKQNRRRQRRGVTMVEMLIAAVVIAVSVAGVVSIWQFSYSMTGTTDSKGVGYNLGRAAIESVKETGFTYAAEGTTTSYYDQNQNSVAQSAAKFKVVTSVVSSAVSSGSIGVAGAVPTATATRTVTVTVTLLSTSQTVYSTSTVLVKAGI